MKMTEFLPLKVYLFTLRILLVCYDSLYFIFRALSDLSVFTSTNRVRSSQSASGFATIFSRSPPTQKAEPVSISMFYMAKVRI